MLKASWKSPPPAQRRNLPSRKITDRLCTVDNPREPVVA
jgi:hypothetical protein